MKRIGYRLTCDLCPKVGPSVFVDEGAPAPDAEQVHRCTGTRRPTMRVLKYRGEA